MDDSSVRVFHRRPGAARQRRRKRNMKCSQKRERVSGPTNRYGCGAYGIFQDQVPADDPREELADRRISVSVGAAGNWDHGSKFRVAEPGKGAPNTREN